MKQKCLFMASSVFIFVMHLSMSSCDTNRVYEEYIGIQGETWSINQPVLFVTEIQDTSTIHNIFLNVRNTNTYDFSNLFLFIKTTSPSGQFIQDTLEIKLADEQGRWLGRGISSVFFNRSLYKRNIRFPYTGTYTFEVIHGMRSKQLEGIRDVGLRIEKVEN